MGYCRCGNRCLVNVRCVRFVALVSVASNKVWVVAVLAEDVVTNFKIIKHITTYVV